MSDIYWLILSLSIINLALKITGFLLTEKQLQLNWMQHVNQYAPSLIFFCLALFSAFGNDLSYTELWKIIPLVVATITHLIGKNMIITLGISMLAYTLSATFFS